MAQFVCSVAATLQMIFADDRCEESLDRRADVVSESTSSSDATRRLTFRALTSSCHQSKIRLCSDDGENCSLRGCQQAALAALSSLAAAKVHHSLLHKGQT